MSAVLVSARFLRGTALGAGTGPFDGTMDSLVQTLLPFERASFPRVQPSTIVSRIDEIYALNASPAFAASLSAFANIGTFAVGSAELYAAERSTSPGDRPDALLARDAADFAASRIASDVTFAQLTPRDRARYVVLWSQSAFNTRRRFYRSVRAVAFAAAYSMPIAWRSIGYAGPLLKGPIQ
jgi:hypothetical protein